MVNKTKVIRDRIKAELGLNSRQVSVRHEYGGYSDSIDITFKDPNLTDEIKAKVESIARVFESIDRDETTGEILAGGNTYVFFYDWNEEKGYRESR